jgi:hypothetical protein
VLADNVFRLLNRFRIQTNQRSVLSLVQVLVIICLSTLKNRLLSFFRSTCRTAHDSRRIACQRQLPCRSDDVHCRHRSEIRINTTICIQNKPLFFTFIHHIFRYLTALFLCFAFERANDEPFPVESAKRGYLCQPSSSSFETILPSCDFEWLLSDVSERM